MWRCNLVLKESCCPWPPTVWRCNLVLKESCCPWPPTVWRCNPGPPPLIAPRNAAVLQRRVAGGSSPNKAAEQVGRAAPRLTTTSKQHTSKRAARVQRNSPPTLHFPVCKTSRPLPFENSAFGARARTHTHTYTHAYTRVHRQTITPVVSGWWTATVLLMSCMHSPIVFRRGPCTIGACASLCRCWAWPWSPLRSVGGLHGASSPCPVHMTPACLWSVCMVCLWPPTPCTCHRPHTPCPKALNSGWSSWGLNGAVTKWWAGWRLLGWKGGTAPPTHPPSQVQARGREADRQHACTRSNFDHLPKCWHFASATG